MCVFEGFFGYIGRPIMGKTDLGTVLEVVASYKCSRNISANMYYGHAYGKDVIENVYDGDSSGDYFSVEIQIKL